MINLNRAKEEFGKYLENFDTNDSKITLKIKHTIGVARISEYISKELGLSEKDINLGILIALLHDIGRFEQVTKFNNFIDYETVDHAQLGVKILFENDLIRKFINTKEFDNIISKAIINHNKLVIENGLQKRELLHAKLIRDADKTDNFRVKAEDKFEDILNATKEELENGEITDIVYNDFMNSKIIISDKRRSKIDFWISYLAFIFDFNFSPGLKYIKKKNYINIMIDRIDYKRPETKKRMEEIRRHAITFINKNCDHA
jgi:putative nucleotidyltransferase with HDIG domain